MKKIKKTFNEAFPSLFSTTEHDFLYYVFSYFNKDVFDRILELYTGLTGIEAQQSEFALSSTFRIKYGSRAVNDEVLNSYFYDILKDENGIISTEEGQSVIFSHLFLQYGYKWRKLLENVYDQVYNPIENYNRTEDSTTTYNGSESHSTNSTSEHTDTGTVSDSGSNTLSETNSLEETKNTTTTATEERSDTSSSDSNSAKNVFGFNSVEAVPSDTDTGHSETTGSSNSSSTNTGEESNTVNGSKSATDTNTNTQTRDLTNSSNTTESSVKSFSDRNDKVNSVIKGNIGVTTTQQMLESEIALRLTNDLLDIIFHDICDMMLSLIY